MVRALPMLRRLRVIWEGGPKHQSYELLHRHRRRDYADEVSVAADIYQTDAEALVSVEE